VIAAARQATPSVTRIVGGESQELQLPLRNPPPPDEARALLEQCRRERDEKWAGASYGWRQLLDGAVEWAERVVALSEADASGATVPYEVQAVRIGDFAIVALDGEVFVEYALALRQDSPFAWTAVAAYSNGNVGYVPTAAAFGRGGYEVDTAIRYYGTLRLLPDCERLILETARTLLHRLHVGDTSRLDR